MTTAERIARGHRAQAAYDEFLSPMFDELEAEYSERIVDVANGELHPGQRSDKITALSLAIRVVRNMRGGMLEHIRDGELARKERLRSEEIEKMSDARQRLLRIAGV